MRKVQGSMICCLGALSTSHLACGPTEDPPLASTSALDIQDDGVYDCGPGETANVLVAVRELAAGPVELAREASLQLELTSEEDARLTVVLTVTAFIGNRSSHAKLPEVVLDAGESIIVDVPAGDLSLPEGEFDSSGTFALSGEANGSGGGPLDLDRLFFHPTATGWTIYDRTARDEIFAHGALTEDEIARRVAWEAIAPEGLEHLSSTHAVRVSEDPEYRQPDTYGANDVSEVER